MTEESETNTALSLPKWFVLTAGFICSGLLPWNIYLTTGLIDLQISQARQDAQLEDTAELRKDMKQLQTEMNRIGILVERVDAKLADGH